MRYWIAAFFSLFAALPAHAKDWNQMNGAERRAEVIHFVKVNGYQCPDPTKSGYSIEQQEAFLSHMSWGMITAGVGTFCSRSAITQARAQALPKVALKHLSIKKHAKVAEAEPQKVCTSELHPLTLMVSYNPEPKPDLRLALEQKAAQIRSMLALNHAIEQ